MSLNKFTSSADYLQKQYLNVGANDIKCTTLSVGGTPITPSPPAAVTGKYDATMTSSVAGTNMLNGFVYFNAYENQLQMTFGRLHQTANPSATNNFIIDLPAGYTSTPLGGVAAVGYSTDGSRELAITVAAVDATGTKVQVNTSGSNTLAIGTCYFNATLLVEI